MDRGLQGIYQKQSTTGEVFSAFLPAPLPPTPPISLISGRQRGRIFVYDAYLNLLNEGVDAGD